MIDYLTRFFTAYGRLLFDGTLDTLRMVFISTAFAYVLGLPVGVGLVLTEQYLHTDADASVPGAGRATVRALRAFLGFIVNVGRSIPFIILLIALLPFTQFVVGTRLGVRATIVPLTVGAIPFVARLVEQSIREIPAGIMEAATAMGSTRWQLVTRVILPESVPSLIMGVALTLITLIGYSAMAGAVGGGGLGDIAIRYGYHRYQADVMLWTIAILVILVQVIQSLGSQLARRVDKRRL
ncbi:MAG: methionine ABC transporter permease [Bacillota bacterium]|nr:methionine ABC transporter permease [Bacillota bacterium]